MKIDISVDEAIELISKIKEIAFIENSEPSYDYDYFEDDEDDNIYKKNSTLFNGMTNEDIMILTKNQLNETIKDSGLKNIAERLSKEIKNRE